MSTSKESTPPQSQGRGTMSSSSTRRQPLPSSGSLIGNYLKLRRASQRPPPADHGDGTYRQVVKRPGLAQDLKSISLADLKTLLAIVAAKLKGETQQDDKTMLMERTIQLVADLPAHSRTQEKLTNQFIGQLWDSLDHPPLLYMGDEYRWRHPDGGFNNPMLPRLGAAGTRYARTVKPRVTRPGALPDPEAVYEAVMARDVFKKNPNNVSSLLWYWATIIIHGTFAYLFSTDLQDGDTNNASSYLDLAPLYGSTQAAQDSVRTFADGLLKPDAFADKRLIGNPPGVCILLVMFNRFHNHVARNLADINEGGRFTKPTGEASDGKVRAAWKKYDEELFQTARLVTSGLYINITLIDYVRNIINLNRVDSAWTLDPRQEMGTAVGTEALSDAGVGNAVSAEFNLCYRWHSCVSAMDEKWLDDFFTELLGDKHDGAMDLPVLMRAMKTFEASIPQDPGQRTFGGFARGPDGTFSDDELVAALATAIEQPGGAFGARNVPRILKPVEMLGILRGRRWNLAGLNEFRRHFGLKAHATFEDINSDPAVADQLRNLYQHPDHVELYPGLVAEEAKTPMVPGVGIAPTYTISRVVLSDAVALVRGDRYYTTDYHPGNLTSWGYKEVEYDFNVNHGCVFHKLFLRAFPDHFQPDSVYAHYPMVTPDENRQILARLKRADRFSFDRPARKSPQTVATGYDAVRNLLRDTDKLPLDWPSRMAWLMNPGAPRWTTSAALDARRQAEYRNGIRQQLARRETWKHAVRSFYARTARSLLREKSYTIAASRQVDVVRDVACLAHTHFAARLFAIPLKTAAHPRGVFTEHELYQTLAAIHASVCHDVDPVSSFALRQSARAAADDLGRAVEMNVKVALAVGWKGLFTSKGGRDDELGAMGVDVIRGLARQGATAREIAWEQVIPASAAVVPQQAQFFAQAVDFYLSPAGSAHLPELYRLASQPASDANDALLLGYALEGTRMAGACSFYRETPTASVLLSCADACRDPGHFPQPGSVDPERPVEKYFWLGAGPYGTVFRWVSEVALVALFRAVFSKKGLARVKGPQGMLKKVGGEEGGVSYMKEDWGSFSPFPTTMKVTWEET